MPEPVECSGATISRTAAQAPHATAPMAVRVTENKVSAYALEGGGNNQKRARLRSWRIPSATLLEAEQWLLRGIVGTTRACGNHPEPCSVLALERGFRISSKVSSGMVALFRNALLNLVFILIAMPAWSAESDQAAPKAAPTAASARAKESPSIVADGTVVTQHAMTLAGQKLS